MKNPFAAVAMMAAAMAAAFQENRMRDTAPHLLGYTGHSRGKGRGTPSRRYGNPSGKYMPHQGARECARRAAFAENYPWHYAAPCRLRHD